MFSMPVSKSRRGAVALFAMASAFATSDAIAQAPPFECGPDCSVPGRYVLCNDGFDASGTSAGGVVLIDFLEAACASFSAPAGDFTLTGFVGLFGSGDVVATLLEVYVEEGDPEPGMKLTDTGVGIPASVSEGFSGLFFGSLDMTEDFRICLKQQIDDFNGTGRPLLFDTDGVQAMNTVFEPSVPGWTVNPASGDFILRAVVQYDDLTPWDPGGVCDQPNTDAGVANDGGPTNDGGTPMDSGADPGDGGPRPDTGTDGGGPGVDAGVDPSVDGGISKGPPTITAISPDEGSNQTSVEVSVTGTNFETGLALMIGGIQVNDVRVPGSTTILGEVPAGISPGVYDVVVKNPDEQTAILPDGYTVLGSSGGGGPPVAEGCGCHTTDPKQTYTATGLFLLMVLGLLRLLARRGLATALTARRPPSSHRSYRTFRRPGRRRR